MIDYWTRTFPEERRLENEADLPRRLEVLTPEAAAFWITVLNRAEPIAQAVSWKRPCDYGPWAAAIEKIESIDKNWPPMGQVQNPFPTSNLMAFAGDASLPGWPADHTHLVDFALRFLEADVMLFRSGYTKRHLLRRLRQANLDATQTARAEALARRAVTKGTGLEEFREFCRLTARIVTDDLRQWLEVTADGVYLTLDSLDGFDIAEYLGRMDDATMRKISRHGFGLRLKYAFAADLSQPITKVKDLPADNCIKRNAWRMLRHIRRTGN
ncbi:MAG: hypothetical protein HKN18_06290 [Silicimonas sp.]|nr:hypothetical protein [Silicimonas sp.]